MITRHKLIARVYDRRQEIEAQSARLSVLRDKLQRFIADIQSRSVIYNLIRNLPLWKELEALISERE